MWAFEQIYTGNKYFSLSAIFCMYFWVRGRHHCCIFDIQEIRRRQQEEAALKRQQQVRLNNFSKNSGRSNSLSRNKL